MTQRDRSKQLARLGLTVDQILQAGGQAGAVRRRFSKLMMNCEQRSRADAPCVPVASGRVELIRVEVEGHLLTIADVWGERDGGQGRVERVGARLYGLKTVVLDGATAFMLLAEPPAGIDDAKFRSASGTAVLLEDAVTGAHMLRASGTDTSAPGEAWIFNAVEA